MARASSSPRPANVPAPLTPLIGREREVAAVCELLRRADVRLLVVSGPGGVGKTRLALAVAHECGDDFADGACFVSLAPITDPALVGAAIAQALGLRALGELPIRDVLVANLRDHELLLVLDNFEQVLAAASLVAELLDACARLRALVTSRAVLHLSGEHDVPIAPLALPAAGREVGPDDLGDVAAVRLFVQRAQAVDPDFALTIDNAATVAAIVRRLDGLPLAIELAAARVRVLPPAALLRRLERRLPLLTSGPRDLPARQQTMRDTIAWSYDLLSPAEQALFRRLTVFVGGFSLDAAESVMCDGLSVMAEGTATSPITHHPSPPSVLDGLASLVDKSLVWRMEGPSEEPRLLMLETIREYGLEWLAEGGEAEMALRAHAAYYVALVERMEPDLVAPGQEAWLDRLEAERGNLRVALATLEEEGEANLGLRLAAGLGLFWDLHGPASEGRGWLARTLAQAGPASTVARAKALAWAGLLARAQGDLARALALEEDSLAVARAVGDPRAIGDALNSLGQVAVSQGDFDRAAAAYEEALGLYRGLGGGLWAFALVNLGIVASQRGDVGRAGSLLEDGLAEHRLRGNTWGAGFALRALGDLARTQGDDRRAAACFRECALVWSEHGFRRGLGYALLGLATVARASGEPERAARLFGGADALREGYAVALWATEQAAYERDVAAVRAALGEGAFSAAWAEGRAQPLKQAVAEAVAPIADPSAVGDAADPSAAAAASHGLTPRELDVLRLLAAGRTNAQIAAALFIEHRTVTTHVGNILAKLDVATRTEAATYAIRHGLA